MESSAQHQSGLYSILSAPGMYRFIQRMAGSYKLYRKLLKDYFHPVSGQKVLDIGCGTADILALLPKGVDYHGYDLSAEYLQYAQKKYGNRGKFFHQRVSEIENTDYSSFDYIIAIGVLHHLDDTEASGLFELAGKLLSPTGKIITFDPSIVAGGNAIANLIARNDRGKRVRSPEEYLKIAENTGLKSELFVRKHMINLPQHSCILISSKP